MAMGLLHVAQVPQPSLVAPRNLSVLIQASMKPTVPLSIIVKVQQTSEVVPLNLKGSLFCKLRITLNRPLNAALKISAVPFLLFVIIMGPMIETMSKEG